MTTARPEFIGRPPRQLRDGDTAVSQEDHSIRGRITIVDGEPFVKWEDRPQRQSLKRCGMVLTMRRPGEVLSWES